MSEPLLKAILRLFAVVAGDGEVTHQERDQIRRFLDEHLSEKSVDTYLHIFDEYSAIGRAEATADLHADRSRLEELCGTINADLTQKQKVVIILELINIVQADGSISEREHQLVLTIGASFKIHHDEIEAIMAFTLGQDLDQLDHEKILIIDGSTPSGKERSPHILRNE